MHLFLFREGDLSTKQIVFLQRPSLPQKAKKKESKVNNLEFQVSLAFIGGILMLSLISHRIKKGLFSISVLNSKTQGTEMFK